MTGRDPFGPTLSLLPLGELVEEAVAELLAPNGCRKSSRVARALIGELALKGSEALTCS